MLRRFINCRIIIIIIIDASAINQIQVCTVPVSETCFHLATFFPRATFSTARRDSFSISTFYILLTYLWYRDVFRYRYYTAHLQQATCGLDRELTAWVSEWIGEGGRDDAGGGKILNDTAAAVINITDIAPTPYMLESE